VKEIFKWRNHKFNVIIIFERYNYDYAKDIISEFEKKLFFWKVIFEEETQSGQIKTDFPLEFRVYSEEHLKKIVEFYQRVHREERSLFEDPDTPEKETIVFQRIDKDDCVIRKHTHNKETIYEIRKNEAPTFYYKTIRSLTEVIDSLGVSDCSLISKNKSRHGIEINGCFYYFDGKTGGWPLYKIINNKESIVVCGFSQDLVNWKDYIIGEKIMIAIRVNPITYISNERAVTQDCFGQWEVYDLSGNIIVPKGKYAKIDGFKFNLAKVKKVNTVIHGEDMSGDYHDTFGIIDINGKEVVECEYDTIYKFYGNDKWYTTLIKDGKSIKFHLGYWKTFGNISDVEWYQYLEERGDIEWKGGHRTFKKDSCGNEESDSDNIV
jgi:hypothetical protein